MLSYEQFEIADSTNCHLSTFLKNMANKKLELFLLTLLVAGSFAIESKTILYYKDWIDFNKNGKKDVYEDPSRSIEERANDLLGQMTIEEKTGQLATLYGYGAVLKDRLPAAGWKDSVWKDGYSQYGNGGSGSSQ